MTDIGVVVFMTPVVHPLRRPDDREDEDLFPLVALVHRPHQVEDGARCICVAVDAEQAVARAALLRYRINLCAHVRHGRARVDHDAVHLSLRDVLEKERVSIVLLPNDILVELPLARLTRDRAGLDCGDHQRYADVGLGGGGLGWG
eukprot:scaffold913_cov73-Phaeocystis_antarctica.AAC.2